MAAGLGFKTFTTGEVLTAADTNGYLMQGVLVFATAAARDAAITSPQEGQFAFTKDNNGLWYYDSAAWVASGAAGDIEGVTAGVGISGGGTSGTVTVTNSMATEITAAGDIIVGTGSGTFDNLPIGTTAQVLTADTTVSPYKVKWATPAASASGLTLISSTSFTTSSAHSVNNCFSATYVNYRILIKLSAQTGTNTDFLMRLRVSGTDATTNYISQRLYNASTTVGSDINSSGTDDWLLHTISSTNPTAMSISSIDIFDPFPATPTEATNIAIGYFGGNNYGTFMALVNSNSTSYDGFSLIPVSGTVTGTVRVYGYQNS